MRSPKEIYEAYINGDVLTDEELKAGYKHFSQLASLALVSGPVFRLTYLEASKVSIAFSQYISARFDHKKHG